MTHKIVVTGRIFDDQIEGLRQKFEVIDNQIDQNLSYQDLQQKLALADGALVTLYDQIDQNLIENCPNLKAICSIAVGYNNIDVKTCTQKGIICTNTPGVLTETTADLGFGLMMSAARMIAKSERFLRSGNWQKPLALDAMTGPDIYGSTLGIIGMGRIGRAVAKRGFAGFGMKIVYHNRSRLDAETEQSLQATYLGLDELLSTADHIILVLPYSKEAHHLIATRELGLMKQTATLTNIARGGIVDENALADALTAGKIAAAASDVFESEPNLNPRLLDLPNMVVTPHIGSASVATRRTMCQLAIDNLQAILEGKPALTAVN